MNEKQLLHDLIASDQPPNGQCLRADRSGRPNSSDTLPILESREEASRAPGFHHPGARYEHASQSRPRARGRLNPLQTSPYLGASESGKRASTTTTQILFRARAMAGCLGAGRQQEPARYPPYGQGVSDGARGGSMLLNLKTKKYTLVDLLLDASAVQLRRERHAVDERGRSGRRLGGRAKVVRPTSGNAAKSWTVLVIDTNGNGKRDAYVKADRRQMQRRIRASTRRFMQ